MKLGIFQVGLRVASGSVLLVKIFALPLEPRGCLLLARVLAGNAEGGLKGRIIDGSNPSTIVLGENHSPSVHVAVADEDQENLRAARACC